MSDFTEQDRDQDDEIVFTGASFWQRFSRDKAAVWGLSVLTFVVLLAIFGPMLSPKDPYTSTLTDNLQGPSGKYWFGTDDLGRDILSRMIVATRVSLLASVQAVSISLVIGLPLGLLSGYAGGFVDNLIMRINDAVMSFPALILAVVIVGFLGPSVTNAMIAIGIVFAPRIMRVVRGSTLSVREEVYISSARAVGCTDTRIITRHILPNIMSPLVVQVTLMLGIAILAEAALSFLGLGVQPPQPSWGGMLGRAFPYISLTPVAVIAPGVMISATVLAFNLAGDGFRDSLGREKR